MLADLHDDLRQIDNCILTFTTFLLYGENFHHHYEMIHITNLPQIVHAYLILLS